MGLGKIENVFVINASRCFLSIWFIFADELLRFMYRAPWWDSLQNFTMFHPSPIQYQMSIITSQITGTGLFVQQLVQTNYKGNIKALHYCPFVRGSHRWPVDSPHKGTVMQKRLPCHAVFMRFHIVIWLSSTNNSVFPPWYHKEIP